VDFGADLEKHLNFRTLSLYQNELLYKTRTSCFTKHDSPLRQVDFGADLEKHLNFIELLYKTRGAIL